MLAYDEIIKASARSYSDRIAFHDGITSYTYAEVDRLSASLATGFLARGLRPGDTVSWVSSNRAEYFLAYLAAGRAGLILSPINYWLREQEIESIVELTSPACMIVEEGYRDKVEPIAERTAVQARFVIGNSGPVPGWSDWDDLFVDAEEGRGFPGNESSAHELIFTSGTTGQVKGAVRTQQGRMLESISWLIEMPLGPSAWVVDGGPQFHVGVQTLIMQVVMSGGRMSTFRFKAQTMADLIRQGATYVTGVPAHFALLLESGHLDDVDCTNVRTCLLGGNATSPALLDNICKAFPSAEIAQIYGATESGLVSAIRGHEYLERPESVGRFSVGVLGKIVDIDNNEVPVGDIGEICVKSRSTVAGYYRRDDLTKAVFDDDGYYRMGDLGRLDAEGFLYIVGRKKDMIISGGENIYPQEVEDVVAWVEGVAEVAIVARPDPVFEERVVAVIRLSDPELDGDVVAERARVEVRSKLAGFKVPKDFEFVDEFPRNAIGKIDKVALRAQIVGDQ